ncbi:hypothetical protein Nocox_20115 [Nonomuraea coxensis DSM 45129]|uniref:Secreted protein n=1 Tax=Nonomuraea coxensis DSM 45129 TaxID=1122611 RepID=A0ABX8U1N1_9ACTN|nr:DUF6355 family natural product biosynthesis protein [Nonomuraea coxensis]QYC41632.1 hypothetical protein Nocox_20115 [Nonomuraea coxensis DSM 45129]
MNRTSAARWISPALAALFGAALLASGTPAGAATERMAARNPCNLYRDGDQAMYKNCSSANENIFVTRVLGSNTYYCVTPGSVKHLGNWNIVFRVYNRGGC